MWGSSQPPPLGGAVGCNLCLAVDGVVGLGIRLLIGLLVGRAVGRYVGLMVAGNGIVGLGIGSLIVRDYFKTNAVD